MKKLLLSVIAFVGVSLSAGAASASYVCQSTLLPGSSILGNHGYVEFSLYSGPDCTGSFEAFRYICSTGATSSACAFNALYRATSDDELSAIAGMLATAAAWNQVVDTVAVGCLPSGTNSCLGVLYFK